MKYPLINGKPLSVDGRWFFRVWHAKVFETIMHDNAANKLNLEKKDMDAMAWSIATAFTSSFMTMKKKR